MRRKPSRLQIWWGRIAASRPVAVWCDYWRETTIPYAALLAAVCAAITFGWAIREGHGLDELWSEMGGVTLDLIFIVGVLAIFEHRRGRQQEIARQREVIDDYKRWDHPEAHLRIAGAIRRLNRLGVFALDMAGAKLSDFSFARNGVESIAGSKFFDGRWGEKFGDSTVKLTDVWFDHLDCREVTFSPYNPLAGLGDFSTNFSHFLDCSFMGSDLRKSKFNGSELQWSKVPPDTHLEFFEDEDGSSGCGQISYGPFYQANLQGASFKGCRFKNADFRDAENILEADFTGAKGLEDAFFDSDEIRAAVLAQAAGGTTG
jgi:uncharacterized protein YjbI with pentapeptide repeats